MSFARNTTDTTFEWISLILLEIIRQNITKKITRSHGE